MKVVSKVIPQYLVPYWSERYLQRCLGGSEGEPQAWTVDMGYTGDVCIICCEPEKPFGVQIGVF